MKTYSLRVRLMVLAAVAISSILLVIGISFQFLFQKHVEQFVLGELTSHFEQLLREVVVDANNKVVVRKPPSDPRFSTPNGGLYWQIDVAGQPSLRSRSLWDEVLDVPTPPDGTEENHAHIMPGPMGTDIFALEKLVTLAGNDGVDKKLVVTVGQDRHRVSNAISSFSRQVILGLALAYVLLLGASLMTIVLGLRPLAAVQRAIEKLRTGQSHSVAGEFPREVMPLVNEVNDLVTARETQLERARQRAGNLAHGLKTPLAVLAAIAGDVKRTGQAKAAGDIVQSAGQMRDLVDRELARSRMTDGGAGYRADLAAVSRRIVDTMKRAPRGDVLNWKVGVSDPSVVAMDATDLTELIGNLADNARKYARSTVQISYDGTTLAVEDDGPGVDEADLPSILKRGVRLDETVPGSGIGLSIVSDLADVYRLGITVERSALGGLAVRVALPSQAPGAVRP